METWQLEHHLKELSYTMSMHALTIAEIEGMKAVNQSLLAQGGNIAYTQEDFINVAENNGMTHNDVITRHQI